MSILLLRPIQTACKQLLSLSIIIIDHCPAVTITIVTAGRGVCGRDVADAGTARFRGSAFFFLQQRIATIRRVFDIPGTE
jgi:hypothetical protein